MPSSPGEEEFEDANSQDGDASPAAGTPERQPSSPPLVKEEDKEDERPKHEDAYEVRLVGRLPGRD